MADNALTVAGGGTAVAAPSAVRVEVSRAVGEGIKALQVAFPMVSQTAEDRKIAMGLYAEAVAGFEPDVAEYVLNHLRLHNPRNTPTFTQPPTPQDVYECCKKIHNEWRHSVLGRYVDDDYARLARGVDVPEAMVPILMREALAYEFILEKVTRLPKAKFDAIPQSHFPDGAYARALARRAEIG